MTRLQALTAAAILATGAAACSTGADGSLTDPSVPVHVTAAKEFALQLESNASTGFAWRLASPLDPSMLVLLGSSYAQGRAEPGASGVETWRFQAVASGRTSVTLEYARPWETNVAPLRTVVFTVVVE